MSEHADTFREHRERLEKWLADPSTYGIILVARSVCALLARDEERERELYSIKLLAQATEDVRLKLARLSEAERELAKWRKRLGPEETLEELNARYDDSTDRACRQCGSQLCCDPDLYLQREAASLRDLLSEAERALEWYAAWPTADHGRRANEVLARLKERKGRCE